MNELDDFIETISQLSWPAAAVIIASLAASVATIYILVSR